MRPTTFCEKCQRNITNNNYQKHVNSCVGLKVKKIRGIDYDPNWGYKFGVRKSWNKGLTKNTDERIRIGSEKMKSSLKALVNQGITWGCTTTEYLDSAAFKKQCSRGGGYRENAGHSKKFHVLDSFGNKVCLQSTYELICSEILRELSINWIRPKALKYDGKNYFADFYLPDFNIWLDPKNDYKAVLDKEKIEKVREQNNIKLYVLSRSQLTHDFILNILG